MTRRKNPYSTRWDKQISLSRLTGDTAQLYSAFEMIQTALYYEGILIDLDPQSVHAGIGNVEEDLS